MSCNCGVGDWTARAVPDFRIPASGSDTFEVAYDLMNVSDSGSDYEGSSVKSYIANGLRGPAGYGGLLYHWFYSGVRYGRAFTMEDYDLASAYNSIEAKNGSRVRFVYDNSTGMVQTLLDNGVDPELNLGGQIIGIPGGYNEIQFLIWTYARPGYDLHAPFDNFEINAPDIDAYLPGIASGDLTATVEEQFDMISPWDGLVGRCVLFDHLISPENDWMMEVENGAWTTQDSNSWNTWTGDVGETMRVTCLPDFVGDMYLELYLYNGYTKTLLQETVIEGNNGKKLIITFLWNQTGYLYNYPYFIHDEEGNLLLEGGTDTYLRDDVKLQITWDGSYISIDWERIDTLAWDTFYAGDFEALAVRWYIEAEPSSPSSSQTIQIFKPTYFCCKKFTNSRLPKITMSCFPFGPPLLEITQKVFLKFNLFMEKIINSLDDTDPETVRGCKLHNIDGQNSYVENGSVCICIDKYRRIYTFQLKQGAVEDNPPDIINLTRSPFGHYWELIHTGNMTASPRIYGYQCMSHVSDLVPGICEYPAGANTDKVMLQLVHESVVNPLYLRAFKVPGMSQARVEITPEYQPMTAQNVKINFILVDN